MSTSTTTSSKKSTKADEAGETEKPAQMIDVSRQTPEKAVELLIARAVEMEASDLFIVSNEQHVAALGDLQLGPTSIADVTGNSWAIGAALVIR